MRLTIIIPIDDGIRRASGISTPNMRGTESTRGTVLEGLETRTGCQRNNNALEKWRLPIQYRRLSSVPCSLLIKSWQADDALISLV